MYWSSGFLINFLSIVSCIFLWHYWMNKKGYVSKNQTIFLHVLAIILCMAFPIINHTDYFHDFREIPIIFGGLFYGPSVGLLLLGVATAFRLFYFGINSGTLPSLVIYGALVGIIILFSKNFKSKSDKKQMINVLTLEILFCIIRFSVIKLLVNEDIPLSIVNFFDYFLVPVAAISFIYYIFKQVTNNVLLKEKTMASEKMEIVSLLAASLSHEVRNPLTVTRGFLQLCLNKEASNEDKERYIKTALFELDNAEGIISEYLTFAKPNEEKQDTFSINDELKRVSEITTPLANLQGVETQLDLSDEAWINGDVKKFQQCMLNFTKNCIEAMPDGGILTITTRKDRFDFVVEIKDSGVGMTEEQINRFGEPYLTSKKQGTGLGMMTSLHIIKGLGGRLSINSKVNEGTTFKIYFPL